MEAIHGVTIELLAETFGKHTELQAQYGDQAMRGHFEQYLAGKGLNWNVWAHAHNAWMERFKADPSGKLEAQFHMLLAQAAQRAHYGDVRDMTQDQLEGVTLDKYAQLTVAMSAPGADAEAIARQHGLDGVAHWQRVNAAWTQAMSQDTDHKLTMQYGQLYQKHAGPAFQQQMMDQSAAILAESHQQTDVVDDDEEEEPMDRETLLAKLKSKSRNERWEAARWLAHEYSLADLDDDPDARRCLACVPVLVDILEHHDNHTVSNAEDAAQKLVEIGQRNDDTRNSMEICLGRAREKLGELQAAFAPIQNKAVPERVHLQSSIQDYTSLIQTLEEILGEWEDDEGAIAEDDYDEPVKAAAPARAAQDPVGDAADAVKKKAGGFFKKLFGK
jgi:hypothetical protein